MTIEEVRNAYFSAIGSQRKIESLLNKLQKIENLSPVLLSYLAACEAMVAQYSWNPYIKLAQVQKAFRFFDRAIRQDIGHAEIRFLRFSVQHNLPDFLRKQLDFEEDKRLLLEKVSELNYSPSFFSFVKSYLKESNRFKVHELEEIENV